VLGGFPSSASGTYSFVDKNPPIASDMYRLKIEDLNGAITYSNVVTIMYSNTTGLVKSNINVYPNPARSTLNLEIVSASSASSGQSTQIANSLPATVPALPSSTIYSIKIVNILGSVIKTATTATLNWQADVSNLAPGTYILQVVNNSNKTVVGESAFIKL